MSGKLATTVVVFLAVVGGCDAPSDAPVAAGGAASTGLGGTGAEALAGASAGSGGDATNDGGTLSIESFAAEAAAAICGALYRCCDPVSIETYFLPYAENERLASFADALPPASETECRSVLAEMLAIAPFGDWIVEAKASRVTYLPSAFESCASALADSSCGEPVWRALQDSTCLGFAPPAGGTEQRSMFTRTGSTGQECGPIRDGVGSSYYGTCAPSTHYCCYDDPSQTDEGCVAPFSEQGARTGTCQPVAAPSAACSNIPPLLLCATGVSCDYETGTCIVESTAPLAVGDACVDGSFNLLGECTSSWCDLFGTGQCEPPKDEGEGCGASHECASGHCAELRCVPYALCLAPDGDPGAGGAGAGGAGAGGAGVGGAGSDDAAERCETAPSLSSASVAQANATYPHRVDGHYGSSNDYNPYQSASPALPPNCSMVYDSRGKEVVYAVTLDPGQWLQLRLTPSDTDVRGALYLLDHCSPSVSWPDYDGSGLCGDNEYSVASGIGATYWYPVEWSWRHPTSVEGAPASVHTFYVVVDQVEGEDGAAFSLEWNVTN